MNTSRDEKIVDAKFRAEAAMNMSRGPRVVDTESRAEVAMKKTCTGRIIKPFAKAKDAIDTREDQSSLQKAPSPERISEIKNLIVQLTYLLEAWDKNDEDISANLTQTEEDTELGHDDPLRILATRINLANATDQDQFICFT